MSLKGMPPYVARKRMTNSIITMLMVIFGIVLIVYGTMTIVSDFSIEKQEVSFRKKLKSDCVDNLQLSGFIANQEAGDLITVRRPGLADAPSNIYRSSIAIQSCIGYKLDSFCLGEGCELVGLSFSLAPTVN